MGELLQHMRRFKGFKVFIFSTFMLIIALCFAACTERPKGKTKAEVIRERLSKKVNQWRASVEDKCRRDVMTTATKIVDSTLIANARARKEKEENRPKKPRKPGQPEVEIPEDTTPIAPLFLLEFLLTQDSAYLDSLLSSDTIELELLQLLEKDSMWFNNFEEQQDTNKLKNNGQN